MSSALQLGHRENWELYRQWVEDETNQLPKWDIVVLTAGDEAQAAFYQRQIDLKQDKHLPAAKYVVLSDPPGTKIGNGGCTLLALQYLSEHFERSELETARVLIIMAGGLSKRLPHVSAVGKLFTSLPISSPLKDDTHIVQMLELKLAMYAKLVALLAQGSVLVTCADDIELFYIPDWAELSLDKPGIIALAHPSTLEIGETHGVFCFDPEYKKQAAEQFQILSDAERVPLVVPVKHFLHKPKASLIRDFGADLQAKGKGELVYTDSVYMMDRSTADRLVEVANEIMPLNCEIDAYGDFLQALGTSATDSYITNTKNVVKVEPDLVNVRKKVYDMLQGTPFYALILNGSKFCHIGTVTEYFKNLSDDADLHHELNFTRVTNSKCGVRGNVPGDAFHSGVVVIDCHFSDHKSFFLGSKVVLEHSKFGPKCTVENSCIVSRASVPGNSTIPSNTQLFVVELDNGEFAAIVLGVADDLKKAHKSPAEIKFGAVHIDIATYTDRVGQNLFANVEIWPAGTDYSLWDARLFPCLATVEEASYYGIFLAHVESKKPFVNPPTFKPIRFISLQETLATKKGN